MSCRLRWVNYLRPDMKRGNFRLTKDFHRKIGNNGSDSVVSGDVKPPTSSYEIKNLEDEVKDLNEQLSVAHDGITTKENAVKQHAKVVEDVVLVLVSAHLSFYQFHQSTKKQRPQEHQYSSSYKCIRTLGIPFSAAAEDTSDNAISSFGIANMERKQNLLMQEQQLWQQYGSNGMQGQGAFAKINASVVAYNGTGQQT
ncbi:putative clathrin assembly protein [Tanacetum coccineum]